MWGACGRQQENASKDDASCFKMTRAERVYGREKERLFCSCHCTTDSRAWAGADARGSVWKSPSQEASESVVVAGGPEPEAYHGLETMNQDRYLRERGLKGHMYIQENRCGRTDIHVRFEVLADTAPWIAS